jgi:hypothetical protein
VRAQRALHSELRGWRVFPGAADFGCTTKGFECELGSDF